ncbi:hypothetical protein DB29_04098 [Shouchella clausii]|nr:hypothetical protein DB29_04098 [Shouchella clausii]
MLCKAKYLLEQLLHIVKGERLFSGWAFVTFFILFAYSSNKARAA